VYVAAPYSKGDVEENVRVAITAAHTLMDAGYAPYCPHLSHYMHLQRPRDYEDWMALDFVWLTACNALVRLPGESSGADREVEFAKGYGIPVFGGVDAFLWAQDWEGEQL
jgi:hypothetical protein